MVKSKVAGKKGVKTNHRKSEKKVQIDKILVENFVSLQKVMTNLASKFDNLSTQISKLLELFEISAKTLAEKDYAKKDDKKVVDRLDSLLEQNKVIAKGIALIHEKGMPEEKEVVIMPPRKMPPPVQPVQMRMPALRPNVQRMPPQQMQTQQMQKIPEPEKKPFEEFSKIRYTKE